MDVFPLFLELRDRPVLVVGGGEAAARKVRLLRRAGARPLVLAEALTPELAALAASGEITHRAETFTAAHLEGGVRLVVAATGGPADEAVSAACAARGVPVNVVDRPELCTVTTPSIVDRGAVTVAIATGGAAPVLARRIRERLEAELPPRLGDLARFAESYRPVVKAALPTEALRRRFWERVFDGPIAALVLRGDEPAARAAMLAALNRAEARTPEPGRVALVGTGPGDPDLLTLKAHRLLSSADVIVTDRLVGAGILDLARRDAERIFVGKTKGNHTLPQGEINALLIRLAEAGRQVVRLKGGDPFVFGRGGEEMTALRAAGIDVEIVPGVTSALGAAAIAGIPLTHRDHASAVSFVTGHGAESSVPPDWSALAATDHTLVVYMGIGHAAEIAASLIAGGRDPGTPAAVIENATLPGEAVRLGTLADLPALAAWVGGPALLIVGATVALAEGWARLAVTTEPARAVGGAR